MVEAESLYDSALKALLYLASLRQPVSSSTGFSILTISGSKSYVSLPSAIGKLIGCGPAILDVAMANTPSTCHGEV